MPQPGSLALGVWGDKTPPGRCAYPGVVRIVPYDRSMFRGRADDQPVERVVHCMVQLCFESLNLCHRTVHAMEFMRSSANDVLIRSWTVIHDLSRSILEHKNTPSHIQMHLETPLCATLIEHSLNSLYVRVVETFLWAVLRCFDPVLPCFDPFIDVSGRPGNVLDSSAFTFRDASCSSIEPFMQSEFVCDRPAEDAKDYRAFLDDR